jgi:hypothetical protein
VVESLRVFDHVGFFCFARGGAGRPETPVGHRMEKSISPWLTRSLGRNGVKMQHLVGENGEAREESIGTKSESFVEGTIVDSWVESARSANVGALLVMQVAPRGQSKDLVIVEAEVSLVSDRLWLKDLGENLCHGSPVLVIGSWSFNGFFAASRLQLMR